MMRMMQYSGEVEEEEEGRWFGSRRVSTRQVSKQSSTTDVFSPFP